MKAFEWNDESAQIFAQLVLSVYKTKPNELGAEAWKFDMKAYKYQKLTKKMEMFKADYVKQKTDSREQLNLFAKQLQDQMQEEFKLRIEEFKEKNGIQS